MSSFSIKGISQLNLSLNIDNKKNIENIQIIINDLKELMDILSFRISDVSTPTQQQIAQNDQEVDQQIESIEQQIAQNDQEVDQQIESIDQQIESIDQQIESIVYDATIPDFSGGTCGDSGTDGGTGGETDVQTTSVVGYFT